MWGREPRILRLPRGRDLTMDDITYNIDRQKAGLLADGSEAAFGRKTYWNKVDSYTVAGNALTHQTREFPMQPSFRDSRMSSTLSFRKR